MKTLTKKELKLQRKIQGRHDGTIAKYVSSEELPPPTELTVTDVDAFNAWSRHIHTDVDVWVTKANDWTLSADERRTAGERQQRAEDALLTTSGELWWGKLSPSGFGPVALEALGTTAQVTYDGTEVITTIEADSPDDVRVDAGIIEMGQFRSKIRKGEEGRMYSDFVGAARFFTVDDDEHGDLWTDEGYDWERLETDTELAVDGPSFTAYWE